jgi:hypothetical protein
MFRAAQSSSVRNGADELEWFLDMLGVDAQGIQLRDLFYWAVSSRGHVRVVYDLRGQRNSSGWGLTLPPAFIQLRSESGGPPQVAHQREPAHPCRRNWGTLRWLAILVSGNQGLRYSLGVVLHEINAASEVQSC